MTDVYELAVEHIDSLRGAGFTVQKVVFDTDDWDDVKGEAEHHPDARLFGGQSQYTVAGVNAYYGVTGDARVRVVTGADFDE